MIYYDELYKIIEEYNAKDDVMINSDDNKISLWKLNLVSRDYGDTFVIEVNGFYPTTYSYDLNQINGKELRKIIENYQNNKLKMKKFIKEHGINQL
jgi:PhoPQ-activated pathogenicity-related protein